MLPRADKWIRALQTPSVWDQNAFNDLVRMMPSYQDEQNLFRGDMGSVTVGVLPASIFASGHMFFVQVRTVQGNGRGRRRGGARREGGGRGKRQQRDEDGGRGSTARPRPFPDGPLQRKYQELGLEPYVAHATFQYSGTPGKRERFREMLLFDDPPEYFDHARGFIAIK